MGWNYKDPSAFPAAYIAAIREASFSPGEPRMLGGFINHSEAKVLQEKFRHLRWCIRQIPTAHPELFNILETFDVRTSIANDPFGYILWLTAKPTKISEFIRLNPELADEILPLV